MQLEEKLKQMVNKTWMYKTRNIKLLSFKINAELVTLVTDVEWIDVPIRKINQKLSEFLPVNVPVDSDMGAIIFKGNGKASLKDLIYENIEEIKRDPSYIPKAKALNEQVKTVIEMAKLELQIKNLK